ncbi:unnamed protein product [Paramecium octaurelia]|uniref:Uncharacterized protein n=1 Tax=Paramecium octaurelia TaxID=43137 RepID=A0A8S1WCL3_PAROT|nr:unnamed protein product [Paramecium octaurelia]
MNDHGDIKRINVYIPFIEIYLQLEIKITSRLHQLAEIIHQVTSNDNELNIFRQSFKYNYLIQIQRRITRYGSSDSLNIRNNFG